jgi:uncharacterized protein (DUF1501 family)
MAGTRGGGQHGGLGRQYRRPGLVEPARTFTELVTQPRSHVLEHEYNRVTRRSIEAEAQISTALAAANLGTVFPTGNTLADQLRIVARLVGARSALGNKRQVFMVSLGGFIPARARTGGTSARGG